MTPENWRTELKVAITHYWLVGMRGGENALEIFCDLFPQADIYTLVCDRTAISEKLRKHDICTSFIQKMPWGVKKYQQYLPLHPIAIEQFDLNDYDFVLSSESGSSKGVITSPETCHVCYCHTPMRYLWNMYHEYKKNLGPLKSAAWMFLSNYLRLWDYSGSQRIDYFIANSNNVRKRIRRYYGRDAYVLHCPVDFQRFRPKASEGYYLFVGQLVPYKKADLAVRAFNALGRELIVVGDGEQLPYLRKIAGENVKLLGRQSRESLLELYSRCEALIFPGEEDWGIVPLEAMACGKPVIALARGGALESVVAGHTGLFFNDTTVSCLVDAVRQYENMAWDREAIRNHAGTFDIPVFREELNEILFTCYRNHLKRLHRQST